MNKKLIESPLAKYDKLGSTLTCILCNTIIKKQEYWTGHVNGRVHRDNLLTLKRKRGGGHDESTADPSSSSSSSDSKRSKTTTTTTTQEGSGSVGVASSPFLVPQIPPHPSSKKLSNKNSPSSSPHHGNNSNGLLSSTNNNNNGNINNSRSILQPSGSSSSSVVPIPVQSKPGDLRRLVALLENSDLPPSSQTEAGAYSTGLNEQEMEDDEENLNNTDESTSLPEGFFDDPKKDARARGQVWADPEQLEWDKFVREMAVEEVKSTSIQNEDEEESTKSRELDEIEEQMSRWQRLILLEKRAEELAKRNKERKKVKKLNVKNNPIDNDDDEDQMMENEDVDEGEEFNWRSKKSVIKK